MGLEECRGNQQVQMVTAGELSQKRALNLKSFLADKTKCAKAQKWTYVDKTELSSLNEAKLPC